MHKTLKASIILVLLLVTVVVLLKSQQRVIKTSPKLLLETIGSFTIGEIEISKKDGEWMVSNRDKSRPADKDRSEQMISQLLALQLGDPISDNINLFGKYGILDGESLVLKSEGLELEIGRLTDDYNGTFVKHGDLIYRTDIIWNRDEIKKYSYWENKKVSNLPLYQIQKMTLRGMGKQKVLSLTDGERKNEITFELVSGLVAESYLDDIQDKKDGLEIEIEGDGFKQKLWLGVNNRVKKDTYYWASPDLKNYYKVSDQLYKECEKILR